MAIKCYLVSDRAKQLNHTYYSLDEVELFYNLDECTYKLSGLNNKTFVYEVEVKPEDVFECNERYLIATSFKIVKLIDLKTIITSLNFFSSQTIKEIDRIFNGKASKGELVYKYKKAFERERQWTEIEQVKFLAILSQSRVELPMITISNSANIYLIRLLEFYNRPYQVKPLSLNNEYIANKARHEALKGSNKFEYIENEPIEKLIKNKNFYQMLKNRKLSQKQFEEYCEYKTNNQDERFLSSLSVEAGYEILPKYKELFYPYVIYQNPELVKDIVLSRLNKIYSFDYEVQLLLKKVIR